MRATALVVSAALMCGAAALAQQQDPQARGDESARAEQQEHGATAGEKLRGTMHKLGDKTRHAMHRMGDKMRHVAHRDKDKSDTRAMGAAGSSDEAVAARQRRMDDAYANWQTKQARQDKTR